MLVMDDAIAEAWKYVPADVQRLAEAARDIAKVLPEGWETSARSDRVAFGLPNVGWGDVREHRPDAWSLLWHWSDGGPSSQTGFFDSAPDAARAALAAIGVEPRP